MPWFNRSAVPAPWWLWLATALRLVLAGVLAVAGDATLISLASQAGAPGLGDCVRERTFDGWTARVTDQSSKDKVVGTPTIRVAGRTLTDTERTPAALLAAVQAATKP